MKYKVKEAFFNIFGVEADHLVQSPGRVNIIGEHTDYNDGFVLPMGIDAATWLAISPRKDHRICLYSLNFNTQTNLDISALKKTEQCDWPEYIKGVANSLNEHYNTALNGFNAVIYTNIPMGAGLSSSASFELAIARALTICNQKDWDAIAAAKLCQAAENQWVGVNCGIMDQLICAIAKKNHACLIDCRDLSSETVPIPENAVVVIMDTATRRGLVDSAYNERRQQCELAAKKLGVKQLRDVDIATLETHKAELDDITYKRARHVVTENARVLKAAEAMKNHDETALGELLKQSHHSLDQDYEVTNEALNTIVELANRAPSCYGARMTGAGFGGCAVALVHKNNAMKFKHALTKHYFETTGLHPIIYVSQASDGCKLK